MPEISAGAGESLERPDESNTRQVVAGDCGLDMGRRQQRSPSAWSCFESNWPAPRDQVTYEGGHLVDL